MGNVRFAAVLVIAGFAGHAQAAADAPLGTWMTAEGDSKVRIASCGKALCATIAWTRQPLTDKQNPAPGLRKRSLVGVDLSKDMQPDGEGGWKGSIYNPEDGKTYSGTMRRKSHAELEVGGCVLGGLVCGSETWKRQPDDTAMNLPPAR